MVYFKLSKELVDLIAVARLQGLVGCQVYCDRQYISYAELEQVVLKLKFQYTKAKDKLNKMRDDKKKKEEARKNKNPDLLKQFEVLEYLQ